MRNRSIRMSGMLAAVAALMALALPAFAGGRPLHTELSAGNEVTPIDLGATGSAHITLNQGQGTVCFEIDVDGATTPILAAHIHAAPAGVNGPIVVDFQWATTGGHGCVSADADLIKDIRQSPWDYYINVHNMTAPGGAARGQLTK